jgi:hypothetical protein
MRKPAFTMRTRILPVTPVAGEVGNTEAATLVLLNATPLIIKYSGV